MLGLGAAQADADDAAVAVLAREADDLDGLVERVDPSDVGREADLDPKALARLVGAVADAGEDDVAVEPAPEPEGEDRLEIDRSVRDGLLRVLDHQAAEVVLRLECAR